jgi:Uma2 family endonuclease
MLRALSNWVAEYQQGEVITTPGLIFADEDNVIPDLVWISDEKIATNIDQSGHLTTAPELAVEVLSQTLQDISRDRQAKLKLYSRVGVHEHWIIDWQKQEVEIYRRSQARLQLVCTLFSEDVLTSPLFPEFSQQVAQIFN